MGEPSANCICISIPSNRINSSSSNTLSCPVLVVGGMEGGGVGVARQWQISQPLVNDLLCKSSNARIWVLITRQSHEGELSAHCTCIWISSAHITSSSLR